MFLKYSLILRLWLMAKFFSIQYSLNRWPSVSPISLYLPHFAIISEMVTPLALVFRDSAASITNSLTFKKGLPAKHQLYHYGQYTIWVRNFLIGWFHKIIYFSYFYWIKCLSKYISYWLALLEIFVYIFYDTLSYSKSQLFCL